jgi:hypothetical protein
MHVLHFEFQYSDLIKHAMYLGFKFPTSKVLWE